MSIFKRKGSPYYQYEFTFRGTRHRGSTKQNTKQLANLFEGNRIREVREQGLEMVLRTVPSLEKFSVEFLQWVEATHSLEPSTKKLYVNGWRLLKATKLARMKMDQISNHECETINFPGANYNANAALSTLRRMFSKAVETKRLARIPKIELRKVWGRSVAMTNEQAELIASKMNPGNARDILLLLRATGARPKEAYSLRWELISWENRLFWNPNGKTKSARRAIPLDDQAIGILKRRHLAQGMPAQGWVFPTQSKCGHIVSIFEVFVEARKAAGLPDSMVLYTARHGRMTELANSGLSLEQVMKIGGHSNTAVAISYQHTSTADIQAKLDAAKTTGRIQ